MVVDASLALAWFFEDESDKRTDSLLDALQDEEAVAPIIWRIEIVNAFGSGVLRKRFSVQTAQEYVRRLQRLPVRIDREVEQMLSHLFDLAQKYGLSAYDASYVELALRENLPLATNDKHLSRAAKAAGIQLL
ncbi:MAG: type II toxin-antitoxin system VapC family toxin [Candidatus Eremiobacteraeota bacterium]|nr:type II toxin-antitoxin system VapC family toxin [Candidatus Eremiobacteraeota bacterium]